MTIQPWINFNGNAEEAFNFYKSVFGGEFTKVIRMKDLADAGPHISEADGEKIMRIELPIGEHTVLLANDVPTSMGTVNEHENRSKIAVHADSKEEAERISAGLASGGEMEVPLSESPWGTYFAMFRDKYGIEWTVECSATT